MRSASMFCRTCFTSLINFMSDTSHSPAAPTWQKHRYMSTSPARTGSNTAAVMPHSSKKRTNADGFMEDAEIM